MKRLKFIVVADSILDLRDLLRLKSYIKRECYISLILFKDFMNKFNELIESGEIKEYNVIIIYTPFEMLSGIENSNLSKILYQFDKILKKYYIDLIIMHNKKYLNNNIFSLKDTKNKYIKHIIDMKFDSIFGFGSYNHSVHY